MPVLSIGQTKIEYDLVRSSALAERRVTVTPGRVEVLALASDDDATIEDFLSRKRQWIFTTVREMDEALAKQPNVPRLMSGSKIPYRGRQASLKVRRHDGAHIEVNFRNGFVVDLPAWVPAETADIVVATELKLWLKRRVRRDIQEIAKAYGDRFGLKPRSIRVDGFVGGWGSCGPNGTIQIDWRLIFAPKKVLEYVVVHELAHLRQRNHGDAFWSFVEALLPDYARPKSWLDVHQASLDATFLDAV